MPSDRGADEPNSDVLLMDFHRGAPDFRDREQGRDLGMALYQLTLSGVPLSGEDGEFAVKLLSTALIDCPDDLDAREAKGKLLQTLRRPAAAIDALEALLRRAPRHEGALVTLGSINRDLGRTETALAYWRRAVEVNPWVAEYQKNLVFHLAARDAWEELSPPCRKWLELDPANVDARRIWVRYLLHGGRKTEARTEFAKIRALRPPDLDKLDVWFAEQMR
jgi:tetratricopeptide (TPR) repeat protein